MQKRSEIFRTTLNVSTVLGFVLLTLLFIYGYQMKIFTSPEKFQTFLTHFGIWAPFVFVCVQAIQVIIPILPGNIGCVAGVVAFGPWLGFVYNYVGICVGSAANFFAG